MPSLPERARRRLNLVTDHLHTLPVLVLMPHSRCNARCVMCDIWQANQNKVELSEGVLARHVDDMRRLHVQRVVFSGGEALMHENLFRLTEMVRAIGARTTLLSTGLTLARHADAVAGSFDEVTVSLDGPAKLHDQIRNVPGAYDKLKRGVLALGGRVRVTGRSVVQRLNYFALEETADAAREAGLDEISFLPVDVSSEAFNREGGWSDDRVTETALSAEEAERLRADIEGLILRRGADIASGFIAESPRKLRNIAQYFLALSGRTVFPDVECNAPWTSAVVEADGAVRPCFFHPALGNVHDRPLEQILNDEPAKRFRRNLDVHMDPICRRCVCTLRVGPKTEV